MPRLAAYLIGRVALQGSPVTLVDAAQSFDPYLVARMSRYRELDPRGAARAHSPEPGFYLPSVGHPAL